MEDQALLRENGIGVVAHAEDGAGLLRIVGGHRRVLAVLAYLRAAEER